MTARPAAFTYDALQRDPGGQTWLTVAMQLFSCNIDEKRLEMMSYRLEMKLPRTTMTARLARCYLTALHRETHEGKPG